MVKFKVKLENSGTHPDSFIPEVESTLDDDWEVSFYQDSSKTQPWSTSQGVEIESDELDDLLAGNLRCWRSCTSLPTRHGF
jgi:uncharacterized membrane protein